MHRQKQNKIAINVIKTDWNIICPFKCWIQNQIVTLRSGFSYNQKSISNSKENPWLERNSLWSVIFQNSCHNWKNTLKVPSLSLWRRPRMTSTTNSEAVTRLQKDSHFGIQCIDDWEILKKRTLVERWSLVKKPQFILYIYFFSDLFNIFPPVQPRKSLEAWEILVKGHTKLQLVP